MSKGKKGTCLLRGVDYSIYLFVYVIDGDAVKTEGCGTVINSPKLTPSHQNAELPNCHISGVCFGALMF